MFCSLLTSVLSGGRSMSTMRVSSLGCVKLNLGLLAVCGFGFLVVCGLGAVPIGALAEDPPGVSLWLG